MVITRKAPHWLLCLRRSRGKRGEWRDASNRPCHSHCCICCPHPERRGPSARHRDTGGAGATGCEVHDEHECHEHAKGTECHLRVLKVTTIPHNIHPQQEFPPCFRRAPRSTTLGVSITSNASPSVSIIPNPSLSVSVASNLFLSVSITSNVTLELEITL